MNFIAIRLAGSSAEQEISGISLYPKGDIARWQMLLDDAQRKLDGVSTGIGFWGSPAWVLSGAATLGAIESLASNSQAKEAVNVLRQAASLFEKIRSSCRMFPVSQIRNANLPMPKLWQADAETRVTHSLREMAMMERAAFIKQHELTKGQVLSGEVTISAREPYGILDEEFVQVQEAAGSIWVRWSAVTQFLPKN